MSDTDKTAAIFVVIFIIFVLILAEGGSGQSISEDEADYYNWPNTAAGR